MRRESTVGSPQSTVRGGSCARPRRESGLTVVEMLLAVALLGFVLLGITPLFVASVKSNYSGNEYTSINMLARDKLERLMNMPFADDELKAGGHCGGDLAATLPNPKTGQLGTLPNPFTLTYNVFQYQIPGACATCPPAVTANQPFTPTLVTADNAFFQYKRIDVTVSSGTGLLGIGKRTSRVSGIVSNPAPDTILSRAPDALCP